jgi:hypothetical protein
LVDPLFLPEKIPRSSFLPSFSKGTQPWQAIQKAQDAGLLVEETTLARLDVLEQQDTQGRRAQGTATESGEPMRDMDKHHESIGLKENNRQMVDVFQCHVCFIKRADESDLNILKSKPFRTHASREWELEGKRCWSVDFVSENQWCPEASMNCWDG